MWLMPQWSRMISTGACTPWTVRRVVSRCADSGCAATTSRQTDSSVRRTDDMTTPVSGCYACALRAGRASQPVLRCEHDREDEVREQRHQRDRDQVEPPSGAHHLPDRD